MDTVVCPKCGNIATASRGCDWVVCNCGEVIYIVNSVNLTDPKVMKKVFKSIEYLFYEK